MKKQTKTRLIIAVVVVLVVAVTVSVFFSTKEGFQQIRYNLPMPILGPQITDFKKRIAEVGTLEQRKGYLDVKVGNQTIGNIPDSKWKAGIERMIKNRQDLIVDLSTKKTALNTEIAKAKVIAQNAIKTIQGETRIGPKSAPELQKTKQQMLTTWQNDLKELNALPVFPR
jgi:hypothetical protein